MWKVTSGDYSSYTIHCVCASEAEAEAVCRKANSLWDRYDEWEYSEIPLVTADDLILVHRVSYSMDTGAHGPEIACIGFKGVDDGEPVIDYEQRPGGSPQTVGIMGTVHPARSWEAATRARGSDPERALKAARDRAAQLQAEAEGIA
jgi:hypothetical protein